MTFTSQKFIDTRTGEIAIQIPVLDIGHFEKYHGSAEVGDIVKRYEGVTREQLTARLGRQCSPMQGRDGYVIGPDIHGRICHCSTHFSLGEAQAKARELNNTKEQTS